MVKSRTKDALRKCRLVRASPRASATKAVQRHGEGSGTNSSRPHAHSRTAAHSARGMWDRARNFSVCSLSGARSRQQAARCRRGTFCPGTFRPCDARGAQTAAARRATLEQPNGPLVLGASLLAVPSTKTRGARQPVGNPPPESQANQRLCAPFLLRRGRHGYEAANALGGAKPIQMRGAVHHNQSRADTGNAGPHGPLQHSGKLPKGQ